uniref:Uncharacterized protein n=1 Tax=Lepeophtheirus salmonis TaxID=72036 RepID=A0A0K2VK23_LEPSM
MEIGKVHDVLNFV